MGVPGFFMWLLKKYRNNNIIIQKNNLDELNFIDYFLIDTNCLIHPVCYKILNNNPTLNDLNTLENKMINAIIEYLEEIINYVNPRLGTYIAIDGVAPMTKIKQQRQRRYKSMADKIMWDNIKKKHSKPINTYWNNSAITPGTKFMDKLHKKILEWYETKSIIYSSYLTPGEGEHKLLQFIRTNELNERNYLYVIYGLDADLIFLSLTTKSNKIFLLRESEHFNTNSKNILKYVNITLLRKLIVDTIQNYYKKKYNINVSFDNKRIINDFIFMCYFLGNDFLPHIPSLNIHQNGIEYLIINYIDTIYELTFQNSVQIEYLLDGNKINNNFIEKFLYKISLEEDNYLKKNYNDDYKIAFNGNVDDKYELEIFKIENLQFKINDPIKLGSDTYEEYRKRYYKYYYNINEDEIEDLCNELVQNYIYGLKWITLYYFDKNPSWNWYYQFDISPFVTDIYKYIKYTNFNTIKFTLGKPLKPFIQLLIVLPRQSHYLLPNSLQNYISDILKIYPTHFHQDMINKKKHWMAIPILPSINITTIKNFYKKYYKYFTIEEINNNTLIDEFNNLSLIV